MCRLGARNVRVEGTPRVIWILRNARSVRLRDRWPKMRGAAVVSQQGMFRSDCEKAEWARTEVVSTTLAARVADEYDGSRRSLKKRPGWTARKAALIIPAGFSARHDTRNSKARDLLRLQNIFCNLTSHVSPSPSSCKATSCMRATFVLLLPRKLCCLLSLLPIRLNGSTPCNQAERRCRPHGQGGTWQACYKFPHCDKAWARTLSQCLCGHQEQWQWAGL